MAKKEYDYLVTLRKNLDKKVNAVSLILLFISVCIFSYTGIRLWSTAGHRLAVICFVIIAFIVIWVAICLQSSRIKNYRLALLVAGAYFFFPPFHFTWLGILYIVIGILEKQAKFPQEIGFDTEGVTTNSIPGRFYPWSDLKNVLIKDNLLTLDFKSNKLYQKEIQDFVSPSLTAEFNDFCSKQLMQNTGN